MLTKDEAELYDRQIRLWGVNAQSRLRQSKVLMLGFNGIASEVAKILVLAGVDTLTIVDDLPLQDTDVTSNLFCRTSRTKASEGSEEDAKFRTHQVQEKLRTLNPLVKVNIDTSSILEKKSDDLRGYDLVTLHSFLSIEQTNNINDLCRKNGIKFYLVLDYGFFGFMFNDLGDNFRFTYEEYSNKSKEISKKSTNGSNQRQTGIAKDPISFDDDVGYNSSDDDDHHDNRRPKKRMRLEKQEEAEGEDEDKNEKKHIADMASYVTFRDMVSFKGANFDKKTSPVLFVSIAMLKFYSEHNHLPKRDANSTNQDDLSSLNRIIASMRDTLKLNENIFKKLDPEWSRNITGSLSPVCAIVGGVAGQDMIRALSGKDIPICNSFSFDGIEMTGVVERIGVEDKQGNSVTPVVRDFLQIDDDD